MSFFQKLVGEKERRNNDRLKVRKLIMCPEDGPHTFSA
jgi:hypothetical protein